MDREIVIFPCTYHKKLITSLPSLNILVSTKIKFSYYVIYLFILSLYLIFVGTFGNQKIKMKILIFPQDIGPIYGAFRLKFNRKTGI